MKAGARHAALNGRGCQGSVIIVGMIAKSLKDVLDQAETWPQQDQEELAEYAREIQARRTGIYIMSDQERAAVRRGLAQADRGEFVADDVVAEADKRHDL